MKKNFVVGILLSICLISFGSCEGKNKNYKGDWKEKFKYRINAILLSDGTLLKVE